MTTHNFQTPCCFTASAGTDGLGDFLVAAAVAGFDVPENLQVKSGKVYRYFAHIGDVFEFGNGVYSSVSHTIARTTVVENSDGLPQKIAFAGTVTVYIFPASPTKLEISTDFNSGTKAVFRQTSAPEGWTKETTNNDAALRVVSGTVGVGGTTAFSTIAAQTTVGNHTLTTSELSVHNHPQRGYAATYADANGDGGMVSVEAAGLSNSGDTGGGVAHNHPINLNVKYVDVIVATKD